jgi:CBS domain-containing protein
LTVDWVVWALLGAMVVFVGVAYLAGRTRAGQILAGRSMEATLSAEVREVMSKPARVVRTETTLEEAARVMLEQGIGCLPVVGTNNEMVGIVTESDLTGARPWLSLRAWAQPGAAEHARSAEPDLERLRTTRVEEVMTRKVVTAMPQEPLSVVVDRMMERNLHHVPVVEKGVPVGMLARHDLLGFIARRS